MLIYEFIPLSSVADASSNIAGYETNSQRHFNPANKCLMCATILLKELMIYKLLNYKIASFSSFFFFLYNNDIDINQKETKKTYNSPLTTLCEPRENQDYKD